jgi:ABC-2 type transport system ATP-binding protein
MLVVEGVRHAFSGRPVLRGVDLDVPAGRIVGLVGANGAGKTTLLSIVAGLLRPDGGRVTVGGVDAVARPRRAAALFGLAPQQLGVYPTLTVAENLTCFARLHGLRGAAVRARVVEVAEAIGLADRLGARAGQLSGGQQRLLHTGMAVLHRPRLLFLDEPTVGADVRARAAVLGVVGDLAAAGTAVVYTTHYLTELEQLDADVAILHDGVIVERGPVTDVVHRWGRSSVRLRFTGPAPRLDGWHTDGDTLSVVGAIDDPGARASAALTALGPAVRTLSGVDVHPPSLESAFLALTRRTPKEEDAHVAA